MFGLELTKIPVPLWELDYIYCNNDISFVLKVDDKEFENFKKDSDAQLFMKILEDGYLSISIHAIGMCQGSTLTMDIQPEYKNYLEVVSNLQKIISKDTIDFIVFTQDCKEFVKKLTIFESDKINVRRWLGESVESKEISFKDYFVPMPVNYIVPCRTETMFWFLCKTSNKIYEKIKHKTEIIQFGAEIFDGLLVFYLIVENTPIGTIFFNNCKKVNEEPVYVSDDVRSQFKTFLKFKVISFIINDERSLDENILNVHIKINDEVKKIVRSYMNIN